MNIHARGTVKRERRLEATISYALLALSADHSCC